MRALIHPYRYTNVLYGSHRWLFVAPRENYRCVLFIFFRSSLTPLFAAVSHYFTAILIELYTRLKINFPLFHTESVCVCDTGTIKGETVTGQCKRIPFVQQNGSIYVLLPQLSELYE